MTPTPKFVFNTIIRERREAALRGERVSAEDVADRFVEHHKIRPLLPSDSTLRCWLHAFITQKARMALRVKDEKGLRLILSPVAIGPVHGPRGYVGREAMSVGEHVDLGQHQIHAGRRTLTEGQSRVEKSGQALALGRTMVEPLGQLAAEVSPADEPPEAKAK